MGQHLRNVNELAGKQLFETPALIRGFGMKGKRRPVDMDVVSLLQSFNTPGNEIAPGSDVVREDF